MLGSVDVSGWGPETVLAFFIVTGLVAFSTGLVQTRWSVNKLIEVHKMRADDFKSIAHTSQAALQVAADNTQRLIAQQGRLLEVTTPTLRMEATGERDGSASGAA